MQISTHAMARLHKASPPVCLLSLLLRQHHGTAGQTLAPCLHGLPTCAVLPRNTSFSTWLNPGRADFKLLGFPPSMGCQWVTKWKGRYGRKSVVEGPAHTILQQVCEQSREREAHPAWETTHRQAVGRHGLCHSGGRDPLGMGLEPPFPQFQQPHSEPRISLAPVSTVFLFFQFFYNPLF